MSIFSREIEFIDSLPEIALEAVKDSFRKYDFVVIDYIKNKQWFQRGQDRDEKKIKPVYSRLTVKIKKKKGDPYDRVTWHDTGKLYRSLDLIVGQNQVYLSINVPYYKKLERKYGKKVVGLQNRYLEEFCENYILPEITKRINDKIAEFTGTNAN